MLYFIVQTPYEKCFDLFFKDELGYPNFYRMTELLPHESDADLILVAPSPHQPTHQPEKILQKLNTLKMPYHTFGQKHPSSFTSHTNNGKFYTPKDFEKTLFEAVQIFKNNSGSR